MNPTRSSRSVPPIQAGVLRGRGQGLLLLDVTPPVAPGARRKVQSSPSSSRANTTIPTKRSEIFHDREDNQPSVEIPCCRARRDMAYRNKSLGKFQLTELPPAHEACRKSRSRSTSRMPTASQCLCEGSRHRQGAVDDDHGRHKLADDEIQRMVRGRGPRERGPRARDEAEARNQGDNVIYQTEKTVKEHGDKLDESDRKMVEDALEEAKEALKGTDVEKIKSDDRAGHDGVAEVCRGPLPAARKTGAPPAGARPLRTPGTTRSSRCRGRRRGR